MEVLNMKVLVVEDDMSLQKSICAGLKKFGYAVDRASDGEEALTQYEINEYDAVILDLNLPKIDGIEVLRKIRETDQQVKVLILSVRAKIDDKVTGLDTGANDYMAKPFRFRELETRLRALLRRQFIQVDRMLKHGNIELDTALRLTYVDGQEVSLTKKEYGILEYLFLHKDEMCSAEDMIEHIWDSEPDLFTDTFKVHVNSLKKKLADFLSDKEVIKNTRGVGYYLAKEE
jgi:DNA-binding response OmpR family regulator